MAGLTPYKRVLVSGESQLLSARGKLIVLYDAKDTVKVTAIQNQTSGKSGETYSLNMQRNDKWYAPQEFDGVRITNETPNDQSITLLIGVGDYVRPPPEVPVGDKFGDFSPLTLQAAGTQILPFTVSRKAFVVKAKEDNTSPVFLAGTQADAAAFKGLGLSAGERYFPQARGELWGSSADSAQKIYLTDETFTLAPPPPAPLGTTLVLHSQLIGNPCCHCGCAPPGFFGYQDGNFGTVAGTITPDVLFGLHVTELSQAFNPVQGFTFLNLALPTGTPQTAFTNMLIQGTRLGDVNFASADATFFDPVAGGLVNVAVWQFPAPAQLFDDNTDYNVVFT